MLKPAKLRAGDTIGIVSPSWGGAGAFPHRVEQGIAELRRLGFRVLLAPHAQNQRGFVSDTAANRVADIHAMFADPAIHGIIAAIGGDHACHLLPLLDFDLIARHPKVFMGYSDITVLNMAIWQQTGLLTFNGPTLLTDFAEYPQMFDYTERHFLRATANDAPIGLISPAPDWTEEFLDWRTQQDRERPRTRNVSDGWTWLKAGRAEGRLVGGCIESLQHLRGTRFWPNWAQTIFFFETSEEKPSPATVDGILMDYENMGVFDQISGMLVGRPMLYSAAEKQVLRDCILERTHAYDFPIITDMDFGHTAPQFTLQLGCLARIDSTQQQFEVLESAVLG